MYHYGTKKVARISMRAKSVRKGGRRCTVDFI